MTWTKGRPRQADSATRGYNAAHVQLRKQLVAQLRDGDPCAQCRAAGRYHPLYRSQIAQLHLSHNDDRTGYLGLSLNRCNVKDGARRGRQSQAKPARYSRVW
jgi:hypothetical protein